MVRRASMMCVAVWALVFCAGVFATASDSSAAYPAAGPLCDYHVSVKSASDAAAKIASVSVAMTAGTSRAVDPGFVDEVLASNPVVPKAYFKRDAELHIYVADGEAVVFLRTEDFDDFLRLVEESGGAAEEIEAGDFARAVTFEQGYATVAAVDFGGNWVALVRSLDDLARFFPAADPGEWKPGHESAADIALNLNIRKLLDGELDFNGFLADFDGQREAAINSLADIGMNSQVAAGLADWLRKAIAASKLEYEQLRGATVELAIDGDFLCLTTRLLSKPDSLFGEFTSFWSTHPNLASDTAEAAAIFPAGPLCVNVVAPQKRLIPGFPDRALAFVDEVAATTFPEQREELREALAAYWARLDNIFLTARYVRNGDMFDVYITKSQDAAASVADMARFVDVMNRMFAHSFGGSVLSGRIESEEIEVDGLACTRYRLHLDNPEMEKKLTEILLSSQSAMNLDAGFASLLTTYVAAKDDMLVILTGAGLADDDLPKLLASLNPSEPLFARETCRRAVAGIGNGQVSVGVVDVDKAFHAFIEQLAEAQARQGMMSFKKAIRVAEFEDSNEAMGVAVGAAGEGDACLTITATAGGVNAILTNVDNLTRAFMKALAEEEEDEEGGEEEEEIVLDEEPEAS